VVPPDETNEHNATDPNRLAHIFLSTIEDQGGALRYWRQRWWHWNGRCYVEWKVDSLKRKLTGQLQQEFDRLQPRLKFIKHVTDGVVRNVILHLKVLTGVDDGVEMPAWLDGADHHPAHEYLACQNGLVHVPTYLAGRSDYLSPPSASFFSSNVSAVSFNPKARRGERWHQFLDELWPDDRQAVALLQEWLGLCLVNDMRFDKILLAIGPTRAGKSTIARVLVELVGRQNTAEMTLETLATSFGLQLLIGKTVAVFGDVRLSGQMNRARLAERLLVITGNTGINVNVKFKDEEVFRLPVRFTMVSNKVPQFDDPILAKRFLILPFTKSFYGKEDLNLTAALLAELPYVMVWALEGLQRLWANGKFSEPATAKDDHDRLEMVNSPVERFVEDWCDLGSTYKVESKTLFTHYQNWWKRNIDDEAPKTARTFGPDLLAVLTGKVEHKQVKVNGKPVWHYIGIRPKRAGNE
jgi:putative DNA primase/helicase